MSIEREYVNRKRENSERKREITENNRKKEVKTLFSWSWKLAF